MLKGLYAVLSVGSVANGLWMLVAPLSWYANLPAAVPDTGPFNSHFVRDIGVVYLVAGAGFAWSIANLDRAYPVHVGVTAFFAGHALTHVADIVAGRLPVGHWLIDTPGVFVPAILLCLIALPPVWRALTRGGE